MTATTTTIDTDLDKAEQAAREAAEKAAQLRAEKEARDAERDRTAREVTDAYNQARAADFPKYEQAVRDARDRFEEAVTAGENPLPAWADYQAAQAIARHELSNLESRERRATEDTTRQWKEQCAQWNYRLAILEREHGTHSRHPAVERLNQEITEATRTAPTPITRDPSDTTSITIVDLGVRPFKSAAERYADDDLPAAITRVIRATTKAAVDAHREQVDTERAASIEATLATL